MPGLDPHHLIEEIIEPVLRRMGMHSPAAVNLMFGTAVQESRLTWLCQLGGGPARGIYQIEPATAKDIVTRYAGQRPHIRARIGAALHGLLPPDVAWDENWTEADDAALEFRLVSDLAFQTAIARVRYWMVPLPLPDPDDVEGLAHYWKSNFNTPAGHGTVGQFVLNYRETSP